MIDQLGGGSKRGRHEESTLDEQIDKLEDENNFLNMIRRRRRLYLEKSVPEQRTIVLRTDEISDDDESTDISDPGRQTAVKKVR